MDEIVFSELGSFGADEEKTSSREEDISSDKMEEYEFDSISIPTLSEMDGSEVKTAEKTESEITAMPQFEEMSADVKPVSKAAESRPSSTAGSGTYQGVYGQSSYSQSPQPQEFSSSSRSSFYDEMESSSRLSIAGEKKAKVLAIIVIVLSALDIIMCLFGGFIYIAGAVLRIYLAVKFMKGSDRARWFLGACCVFSAINYIRSILTFSDLTGVFAELGATFIVSIIQFILIMSTLGMGIMSYFFLLDKSVKEYSQRGGWN